MTRIRGTLSPVGLTQAERREWRRSRRLCVRCEAGLTDEDGVTCVDCTATLHAATTKYNHTAKGRATASRRVAGLYRRRRVAKLCVGGCGKTTERARCDECEADKKLVRADYLDRKEATRAA